MLPLNLKLRNEQKKHTKIFLLHFYKKIIFSNFKIFSPNLFLTYFIKFNFEFVLNLEFLINYNN